MGATSSSAEWVEHTRQAWARYVSTGAIAKSLLRGPVFQAWERAHELGANPKAAKAERLSPRETERLLLEEAELIAAARPYMDSLSEAAGTERHAVMLSDALAVVLAVVGDEESVHGPERVPGPGALCSEEVCGSNGLGTPLAMDSYAELVGPEHFIGGFHTFSCQGIPIRNAEGRLAGILSTSVRRPMASRQLRDMLVCAAHGIEAELLLHRLEADIRKVLMAPEDDLSLQVLRKDLARLREFSRSGMEAAARLVARSRFEYALRLLELAQGAVRRIHHRALVWRSLSSLEGGTRRPVAFTELVAELVELLSGEASLQQVELVEGEREPVVVEAEPHELSRQLLRAALQAVALAGPGGAVRIDVRCDRQRQLGEASFRAMPTLEQVEVAPPPQLVSHPVCGPQESREWMAWRLPTAGGAPGAALEDLLGRDLASVWGPRREPVPAPGSTLLPIAVLPGARMGPLDS